MPATQGPECLPQPRGVKAAIGNGSTMLPPVKPSEQLHLQSVRQVHAASSVAQQDCRTLSPESADGPLSSPIPRRPGMGISTPLVREWLRTYELEKPEWQERRFRRQHRQRGLRRLKREAGWQRQADSRHHHRKCITDPVAPTCGADDADVEDDSSHGGEPSSGEESSGSSVHRIKSAAKQRMMSTCSMNDGGSGKLGTPIGEQHSASASQTTSVDASTNASAMTSRHSSVCVTLGTQSARNSSPTIDFDPATCCIVQMEQLGEHEESDVQISFDAHQLGTTAVPTTTLASWEAMRIHFPSDVLDQFAEVYSSIEKDALGRRMIRFKDLTSIAQRFLSLPAQAVLHELQRRGFQLPNLGSLAGGMQDGAITVQSLLELLELMHSAKVHTMSAHPESLWQKQHVEHFENVFQRHVGTDDVLSVVHLFSVIKAMGIEDLDLTTPCRQRFISDVIREMHEAKDSSSLASKRNSSQGGVVTFKEFLYIITKALYQQQCNLRWEVLSREQSVRREAGFSIAEIEDLRELHQSFLARLTANKCQDCDARTVSTQLAALLEQCGVRKFTMMEKSTLRTVVCDKPPNTQSGVTFDGFVFWMHGVFSQNLGGLERQDSKAQDERAVTFMSTLLRECAAATDATGDQQAAEYASDAPSSTDESTSARPRKPRRRKTLTRPGKDDSSRNMSRSNSGNATRLQPAAAGRSQSSSEGCTPRTKRLTRSGSRDDVPSRSSSRCSNLGEQRPELGGGTDIFCLKGLPPSEAMLSRREMRACSVDHDPITFAEQLNAILPSGSLDSTCDVASHDTVAIDSVGYSVSPLVEPAVIPFSQRPPVALPMERKVKPVLDATLLVQGAIARLDDLAGAETDSTSPSPQAQSQVCGELKLGVSGGLGGDMAP